MNYIDYGMILVILLSIYSGYRKGLILSALAVAGWYLATSLSHENSTIFNWLDGRITNYTTDLIPPSILSPATSLIILTVSIIVIRLSLKLLGLLLFITRFHSNTLTRLGGALCGIVYGGIILAILSNFCLPVVDHFIPLENSWLLQYMHQNYPAMLEYINRWQNLIIPASPEQNIPIDNDSLRKILPLGLL